jgi:periplasmic divalent cation tolerance protein
MARESLRIVLSTFPNRETAATAGRTLVIEKLCACANILPGLRSIYRWEGNIEDSEEVLVMFKTTPARYTALEQRLISLHPYKLPEIVALDAADVLAPYLAWVQNFSKAEA